MEEKPIPITADYSRYLAAVKDAFEWATGDALAGMIMAEEGQAARTKANWEGAAFADYVLIEASKEMNAAGMQVDFPPSSDYPAGFNPHIGAQKKKEKPRWRRP